MTLENFAHIADIVGVLIVVASLIYVARELHQNTAMMRAESRNEIVHSHQQEIFALIEHPEILQTLHGNDLDDSVVRVHSWLTAHCRAREHEWFQLHNGALDRSAWESYSSATPIVLSGPKARAWWDYMKRAFDASFVAHVDEMLEKSPLNELYSGMGASLSDALSTGSIEAKR